jgi:cobyrinic acid a,c-diamide synthase
MDALRRAGLQVQDFLSRSCFPEHPAVGAITGLAPRHLDSWLMPPAACHEAFMRGVQGAHLAVVEGCFGTEEADPADDAGGRLEPLCEWLDLPRLAVLDAAQLGNCSLPPRPQELDGLLLDGVRNLHDFPRVATNLEALWGIPVLGGLEILPGLRAEIAALPCGERPAHELCQQLGDSLARTWNPKRLLDLADREMPERVLSRCCCAPLRAPITVAIAYDEAFNCYFPDTLDMLEARGASVVDFSPLRDENLPPQCDIVYFGCGHPERYAAALSENHCMAAALRSHLCAGRRVYGEGGGAAYLCQQMETPNGEFRRMAGVLPAVARFHQDRAPLRPVDVTLAQSSWLGNAGTRLRGYRNNAWSFDSAGQFSGLVADPDDRVTLAGAFQSVGSLLHLNFAAQPSLLNRFFRPQIPATGFFSERSLP